MLHQPLRRGPDSVRYRLSGSVPPLDETLIELGGRLAYRLVRDGAGPAAALVLVDPASLELLRIEAPALRLRDSLSVLSGSQTLAVIRRVLEPPFREEFRVDGPGDHVWHATGRIAACDYCVREGGETVARVKTASTGTDRVFDVVVQTTVDAALILIVVVAINKLAGPRAD